ncbi:MAG: TlpA family protein disulfide reductase [Deltaproteobacteria bacterium]|nr:TlpA family protein disulfide reductase [Deltaproteobacteria bacterium]
MTRSAVLGIALGLALSWGGVGCVRSAATGVGAPVPRSSPEGEVVPVEVPQGPLAAPGAAVTTEPPEGESRVEVGHRYVDFSADRLGGGRLRLSELVGPKVVVLQFWGVRCSPCLAEMAFLSELQSLHPDRLQVVGVNTDRAPEGQLREIMVSRAIIPAFPVVADPDFTISRHYTQWLVPVSVLIDRRGIARAIHTGYNAVLGTALRAEVEGVLAEE